MLKKWKDISIKFKLMLYIVTGVTLILTVSTVVTISTVNSQTEEYAYLGAVAVARAYSNQLDGEMQKNMAIARSFAHSMEKYESNDREEVNQMLSNQLLYNPDIVGIYVGFEPDAFDGRDAEYAGTYGHDETGRFLPYWNTINGEIDLEPLVDYDTEDYYQLTKSRLQDTVTDLYYYQGIYIVSYVSPIIKNDEFIGIAGTDVSLEYLDETMDSIRVYDTGYAFITDSKGTLVTHPINKEWASMKSLYDFGDPFISNAADNIGKGIGGTFETIDPATGKEVIFFYEPITTGNYSFLLVIPREEIFAGSRFLAKELILISFLSIIFMSVLAYFVAFSITESIKKIVSDFGEIAEDAVKGNLDSRADTDVDVDFRNIPHGLNKILDAFAIPIRETVRMTKALSEGELSTRTRLDLKGEFKQMGDALDDFAQHLDDVIDDSNAVLMSIQENDFSREVRVHGEGDFEILTKGIEETRKALLQATNERMIAEKALREADKLREKEIHHRVKNNLQIISSLLFLESERFRSKRVVEAFRDSRNRIRSMALVHEKLYKTGSSSEIDFQEYTQKLLQDIMNAYPMKNDRVMIKFKGVHIMLSIDQVLPLGMIINELVSNSLKYAFPEGEGGEITVTIEEQDKDILLQIKDNGVGFPEDIDIENNDSLGLKLVMILVKQLEGTIKIERNKGTVFSILFKQMTN
ncbi:MAG: histidine kinase dimerization/phosphoacceptor domain -containing protein [Methanolobus sp.]|uniref:histidine kinase dimerization/phosphoacceptor domain -containing protein n=1 Tax=Methanolobus sp. TaxID=1874737 RepID=UPI00273221D0|nr:histidine kinase dimerization/phosphoacceptor domain -containing protein [Methanolobus sp.]MDP2216579.1 histidine kinase dimerization/phosphoacceptor domain -containing protein [Methanolobus sp.]